MAKTLNEIIAAMPKERQKRIEQHAQELIEEHLALQEVRKAMAKTQKDVAKTLKISQDGVSRIEKRNDLYVSTLRNYIEALGGRLNIVAELPGHPAVTISEFSSPRKKTAAVKRKKK